MSRSARWRSWWRPVTAALALTLTSTFAAPAQAWDPSTTHLGMLERSVLDSAMHLRWMDASQLQRGLFTPIRLDPSRLDDATLRELRVALRNVHAASGAQALGGPGACPGPSAPQATRARCVDGDLWEMTALGWMELGVIIETVPAERLLHHFVDREDPSAERWSDDDLPRALLRLKHAKAGGAFASRATGSGFEGSGRSAIAWLDDDQDRWAPPALRRHLRQASLAADPTERDHHLALALLCTGALLHVVQDLSVPANARGDLSASFLPLSEIRGDRGLPLQELARDAYGRGGLPTPVALAPRATADGERGVPRAATVRGHLLGEGDSPGLVQLTGRSAFSESSLPAARRLEPGLDGTAAAALLLEDSGLDPELTDGAQLAPWPDERGYLLDALGRPLAAFRIDEDEQIHLWLDRRVYRSQMRRLIPAGIETGRSVLDLVYSAWPEMDVETSARALTLTPGETWKQGSLVTMVEDASGQRNAVSQFDFQGPQAHRLVDVWPESVADDARVVLVLVASNEAGGEQPPTIEHALDLATNAVVAPATPAVPRPRARPATSSTTKSAPKPPVTVRPATPPADAEPSDDADEAPTAEGDAPPPATEDDAPSEPAAEDPSSPES
ncbi:MAG: hypothetical protein AAF799_32285 [Myxococcota bacterium]